MINNLAIQLAAQGERADRAEQRLREAVNLLQRITKEFSVGYYRPMQHYALRDAQQFLESL